MGTKIKMLSGFVGPDMNWPSGSIQEVDEETAQRLIDRRVAEPVQTRKRKRETAEVTPPETAVIE